MENSKEGSFMEFTPLIQMGFWHRISKMKLEDMKLKEDFLDLFAKYKLNNFKDKYCHLHFDHTAFDEPNKEKSGQTEFFLRGKAKVFNKRHDFENEEMKLIFEGKEAPEFYLAIFIDLKTHNYSYKFAQFPSKSKLNVLESKLIPEELQKELHSHIKNHLQNEEIKSHFWIEESLNFPKKSFVIFDAFNQQNVFSKFLQKIVVTEFNLNEDLKSLKCIVVKDFLYFGNDDCIKFKNSQMVEFQISENESFETPKISNLNLQSFMDAKALASSAVDLNLKLMKWRLVPQLNLEKISSNKCLLIGAGTLGCNLARNLVGWGVRNITFVDCSKVSFSNPVRQTLFTFKDSEGNLPKAETAAERLREIFPGINSAGLTMTIPMPGHFVLEENLQNVLESTECLINLIRSHDSVFLMTDSRESRWLPAVISTVEQKATFTIGLGFDTFIVTRHGKSYKNTISGESRNPCYFCHDITSPGDSMSDRTLDQQCTVTRPGVSFMASAIASELFVGHCQGQDEGKDTCLGPLPYHVRGNLADFEIQCMTGSAFDNCVACSKFVGEEFEKDWKSFVLQADVSRISELLKGSEDHQILEFDDIE